MQTIHTYLPDRNFTVAWLQFTCARTGIHFGMKLKGLVPLNAMTLHITAAIPIQGNMATLWIELSYLSDSSENVPPSLSLILAKMAPVR